MIDFKTIVAHLQDVGQTPADVLHLIARGLLCAYRREAGATDLRGIYCSEWNVMLCRARVLQECDWLEDSTVRQVLVMSEEQMVQMIKEGELQPVATYDSVVYFQRE